MRVHFESNHVTACLLLAFSNAALADQSGTAALPPQTFLNLETGAVSRSGGDLFFDGEQLTPQGGAGIHILGNFGSRIYGSISARRTMSVSYAATPIPAASLATGEIFGVRTNAGRYAKVIVSARNNGALSLQYTLFSSAAAQAAAAGGAPPLITQVQNNYSYILPGLPNYGIAPGSIFVIIGSNLSTAAPPVLQSSAAPGLQPTLNQTSISVTVGGVTTTPGLYYTSATQLAAVLPSTTPPGNGTLTVTYNGQTSAAAPIKVVKNAPGLDTLYGTGNGLAIATDNNTGAVFSLTNAAMPQQLIVLWGSGLGADPANDDRLFPQTQNNLVNNIPLQIFIGGVSASMSIVYAGRSQYPGVDQIDVTIPSSVRPGCFVSVVAQVGAVVSNAVTLPVSANGGPCPDAATGLNGTEIQALANKEGGTVNGLAELLSIHAGGANSLTFAVAGALGSSLFGKGYEYASQGSCTIVPPEQGSFEKFLSPLNAGTIQLSGPGLQLNLGGGPGIYQAQGFTAAPGAYTFTGSGGDIGSTKVTLNVPAPTFVATNQAALSSITRSQDLTVTWRGGFPNGTVQIAGSVGAPALKFLCYAPSSAGQFVVPSSILLAMPAGPGSLTVSNITAAQSISATGLDVGLAGAAAGGTKINTFFK